MDTIKINISHPLFDNGESIDSFKRGNLLAMNAHKELAEQNCSERDIVMLGMAYFSLLATFMGLTDVKILSDRKANILEMIEKIFEKKIQYEIEKLEKGIKEDNDIEIKHDFSGKKSKKEKRREKKSDPEDQHTLMKQKIQDLNHLILSELTKDAQFSVPSIVDGLINLSKFLLEDALKAFNSIEEVLGCSEIVLGIFKKSVERRIETITEDKMKEGEKSNG